MDELFEALTLIQTKRIKGFPVILMGSEYWKGLIDWMKGAMIGNDKIEPCDLEIMHVIDDPDEVVKHIKKFVIL
jgi:predicted Rossmann-fold nucleotide-binding protein